MVLALSFKIGFFDFTPLPEATPATKATLRTLDFETPRPRPKAKQAKRLWLLFGLLRLPLWHGPKELCIKTVTNP